MTQTEFKKSTKIGSAMLDDKGEPVFFGDVQKELSKENTAYG